MVISCKETNSTEVNTETPDTFKKSNNKVEYKFIKNIALSLAKFLKDDENRKLIKNEFNLSKKKENILEASEFLNSLHDLKLNGKTQNVSILKLLCDFIPDNERETFERTVENLEFGILDIYLPLEKWRKNWNGNSDVLVAAVGLGTQTMMRVVELLLLTFMAIQFLLRQMLNLPHQQLLFTQVKKEKITIQRKLI